MNFIGIEDYQDGCIIFGRRLLFLSFGVDLATVAPAITWFHHHTIHCDHSFQSNRAPSESNISFKRAMNLICIEQLLFEQLT